MKAVALEPASETLRFRKLPAVIAQTASASPSYLAAAAANEGMVQRKAGCACGGSCPQCASETEETIQTKLNVSTPGDVYEQEADKTAEQVRRTPAPSVQRKCAGCAAEDDEITVQRKPGSQSSSSSKGFVQNLGSGESLDSTTRAFFESRFRFGFGDARTQRDSKARESAQSVNAVAYTAGRDIVFQSDHYQPDTSAGQKLIAHELTHVVQQGQGGVPELQRTPARQVSCANHTPLHVPGPTPIDIADPVGVITAAENRANEMFDAAIDELDFTRNRILAGAPVGWPTINDAIAEGLRLMGLDPDDRAIWTAPAGTGTRSVHLLLRRLRMIRATIGAGSFFFFCLGTGMTRLGTCAPPAGDPDLCTNANASTCPGEFFTALCPGF